MSNFFVTNKRGPLPRYSLSAAEGDDQAITVDCSAWAEDNGTVTSSTWNVEYGSAGVDGSALASNVVTARITTASAGKSLLTLTITDGTHTKVVFFEVIAKDPAQYYVDDYGVNYG